jgi:hypothetical protein
MASLVRHFWPAREIILDSCARRQKITLGDLANRLGLPLPRQEWAGLLDLIAKSETAKTGFDITKAVIRKDTGVSWYFSDLRSGALPGSTPLNRNDPKQVAAWERELEAMFDFYEARKKEPRGNR